MALILLSEYAKRHGKHPGSVAQKANRGTFKTAVKIGWQWFIDEDEPYTDARITTGEYVGKRRKRKKQE